jgi:prophage regulatory protein
MVISSCAPIPRCEHEDEAMKVLSYEDLKLLKGIDYSRIQLWRREKQGSFPRRIFLSPQRFGWPEHEIDQWIADRIAERDSKAAAAA